MTAMHTEPQPVARPTAADSAARGGYVLVEAQAGAGFPEVILVATGAEVPVALRAREILEREGTPTRVVSMPCAVWFEAQDEEYRASVFPPEVPARVSVEAGASLGWYAMVGASGESVGLGRCGLSAPYQTLYEQLGFTAVRVAAHARSVLAKRAPRPPS
ncbi:transketolase-like TK C-terminal-containing protein [Kitasatospora sp. McL0602]|uniref:transketolase-like TK C-terminal-containing protein n=1 Tax=Kitasatospora sp. McL0602 TaxID=3439530 RepID=UPI003F88E2F3